jgi:CPA2 family monovalent cation:H+ antiporter-2
MEHIPVLRDLTVIIGVGMVVAVAVSFLRLPTAAGLLAAGALIGPGGFGFVESIDSIEVLAEVGVILLLFTIGLEFSLDRLGRIAGLVAIGGALQVGLTIAATAGIVLAMGFPTEKAVLLGFIVSLSSTAIVLRSLAERGRWMPLTGASSSGRCSSRTSLGRADDADRPSPRRRRDRGRCGAADRHRARQSGGRRGRHHRGRAPDRAASLRLGRSHAQPRGVLLAVLSVCIATAWLTSMAGLSLALGAFLGGMVVAGTVYGSRALGDILPLRDVFMSLFFVSLGTLFDPQAVIERPALIAVIVVGFVIGKATLAALAALAMGFPARVAFLSGLGLGQFSEFGFVP